MASADTHMVCITAQAPSVKADRPLTWNMPEQQRKSKMESYYDIVGVPKSATDKEIRQAYRKLARKYHPDLNPGDKEAEDRFKRINEAHAVLSDPESRKKYDRYGENWKNADRIEEQYGSAASGGPFDAASQGGYDDMFQSDIFGGLGDLFGRRRRSTTTRIEGDVEVGLEEAYSGTKRQVTITAADGSNRRIEVTIPPGVDTGSVVRISPDKGQQLLLKVTVTPNKRFTRNGDDLITEVKVPLEDSILGGEVDVKTLKGKVRLKVPPESQNGQRIRLAGQGMPRRNSKGGNGNLYVAIRPVMPKNLTDDERDLVAKLKELRSK